MSILNNINCPNCGQKMEAGFIYSPSQIMWSDNDKNMVFRLFDESDVLVNLPIFKTKKVTAFRCNNCMIATFEYGSPI
jgi:predicted RNA-binding Zn-ribbon protein involved in translation (DUF1610 family)